MKLLEFHRKIVHELTQDGGLLILGKGLGLERVLLTFLRIHTNPRNLILLLNASDIELNCLKKELETVSDGLGTDHESESVDNLKIINNETPAKDRASLYYEGGVVAITSRILVVDILNHVIPTDLVGGILVYRAEGVHETSSIAFALRLFRNYNKTGFIHAFSNSPEAFTGELAALERAMKALQIRNLHLWPRFQMDVVNSIDHIGSVELIELRIGLTTRMQQIQTALLECMNQTISELKTAHPAIQSLDITVESSLFRSFDFVIRRELEPVWHQVSPKTKQLVEDLRTMRLLSHYLVSYDAVAFYSYLQTARAANSLAKTAAGFKQNLHSWLLLDSANVVFSRAKERVFAVDTNEQPLIEEHPKWRALVATLREIEQERRKTTRSFAGNSICC
jgi:DNA excision repair protein ERCC-4